MPADLAGRVDLVVTNPTSRGYGHYYVTLLPSMVLLVVFSVSVIARRGAAGRDEGGPKPASVGLALRRRPTARKSTANQASSMLAIIGGSGLTQLSTLAVTRREVVRTPYGLSLIHISEPTRPY